MQLVVRKNRDENEVNGIIVNLKKCTQCRNLNDDTSNYKYHKEIRKKTCQI